MEAAKLITEVAGKLNDFSDPLLRDSGPIHPGIYIYKNAYWRAAPGNCLLRIFDQYGNARARKAFRNLACATGICAHYWICNQYIGCTCLACRQQLKRGGALEIDNLVIRHSAQHRS